MQMSRDFDEALELAGSLLHSGATSDLKMSLLEPIGSLIGADMAAFREVDINDIPCIRRHASSGVPDRLHSEYLEEYFKIDPAINAPSTQATRPYMTTVANVSHYSTSSYSSFTWSTEPYRQYFEDFLAANQLLNSISLHIRANDCGRLFLLDFHRPSSATAFSQRDLMNVQMICPVVQFLCEQIMERQPSSGPAWRQGGETYLFEFSLAGRSSVSTPKKRRAIDLADPQWIDTFTPREMDVIVAVMKGCSNKELARNLGISVRTAENHLRTIYGKCDVHSRAQLVSKLMGMAE